MKIYRRLIAQRSRLEHLFWTFLRLSRTFTSLLVGIRPSAKRSRRATFTRRTFFDGILHHSQKELLSYFSEMAYVYTYGFLYPHRRQKQVSFCNLSMLSMTKSRSILLRIFNTSTLSSPLLPRTQIFDLLLCQRINTQPHSIKLQPSYCIINFRR